MAEWEVTGRIARFEQETIFVEAEDEEEAVDAFYEEFAFEDFYEHIKAVQVNKEDE